MNTQRQFKKSQTVFCQGDVPSHTYRIKKGLVRAYIIHENGEEATIAFFGPGDIFPIATPFAIAHVALFYYDAVVDTVCTSYSPQEILKLLENDPETALYQFAKRYTSALLHIASLAQNTAHGKIAHILRYLAIRFGKPLSDGRHYRIGLRLTQHDIAKLCNITRETASIELGVLKNQGVVVERFKRYTVDMEKISALIGDDPHEAIEL